MATQTANSKTATKATTKTNGVTEQGHPVTDQLKETLHSSVDKLADSAAVAEDNIRQSASRSADNMAVRKRLAQKKWHSSKVRQYAVENPLTTASIAFATGMLVTSLFRKK